MNPFPIMFDIAISPWRVCGIPNYSENVLKSARLQKAVPSDQVKLNPHLPKALLIPPKAGTMTQISSG